MLDNLTPAQRNTLAMLEREHGMFDYMVGGAPKLYVFVDFGTHTDRFHSYRIATDGTYMDVTDSLIGE